MRDQVIQMNMEIALVCAQLCVMAGARAADNHDLVNRDFIIFNNIIDERIKIAIITFIRWSFAGWSLFWPTSSTRLRSCSCSWRLSTRTGQCTILIRIDRWWQNTWSLWISPAVSFHFHTLQLTLHSLWIENIKDEIRKGYKSDKMKVKWPSVSWLLWWRGTGCCQKARFVPSYTIIFVLYYT